MAEPPAGRERTPRDLGGRGRTPPAPGTASAPADLGEQDTAGGVEVAEASTGAVNSDRPGRRRIASPYLHLRRHHGWQIELDVRNIKQALRLDVLSCKTPAMVRKEVWCHLLAYDLARKVLAQAAADGGRAPRQLSFAGGVQTVNAFRWLLLCEPGPLRDRLVQALLVAVATHEVGGRPGRVEPREVKRRRKGKRMTRPRARRRAELLGGRG